MHRAMRPVVIRACHVSRFMAASRGHRLRGWSHLRAADSNARRSMRRRAMNAAGVRRLPDARARTASRDQTRHPEGSDDTDQHDAACRSTDTNGDLLAITKIDGTNDLAIGGNFSQVYTPDGVAHAATNFAVLDEATGAVLYGGSPANGGSSDKYVRSIASLNGVIYIGGDFTSWAGCVPIARGGARPHRQSRADRIRRDVVEPRAGRQGARPGGSAAAPFTSVSVAAPCAPSTSTTGATIWSKNASGGRRCQRRVVRPGVRLRGWAVRRRTPG